MLAAGSRARLCPVDSSSEEEDLVYSDWDPSETTINNLIAVMIMNLYSTTFCNLEVLQYRCLENIKE